MGVQQTSTRNTNTHEIHELTGITAYSYYMPILTWNIMLNMNFICYDSDEIVEVCIVWLPSFIAHFTVMPFRQWCFCHCYSTTQVAQLAVDEWKLFSLLSVIVILVKLRWTIQITIISRMIRNWNGEYYNQIHPSSSRALFENRRI